MGVCIACQDADACFANTMNWQNSIVNDPTNDSLVRWSGDDVVDVLDVAAFSHQILPQYFSHNNWPSFVRQLNSKYFLRYQKVVSLDH